MATNNAYQMVTDRIIDMMNKGIIPWHRPWHFNGIEDGTAQAISYTSRRAYSLLNQWLLGEPGEYLTFNQIKERKGSIRKGEKARMVVFFKQQSYVEKDPETGKEEVKTYPTLRWYNVWHINQTEGIASKIPAPTEEAQPETTNGPEAIAAAEVIIAAYLQRERSLKFQNDKPSSEAYYSPARDAVVVPMLSQYDRAPEYYSTTFHELVHSTGKPSRCNRESERTRSHFGSEDYSREELVAEMGSAMLCSHSGIEDDKTFRNSVAYLQGWISALKNDNKMIVWAASRAEKAARYIIGGPDALKPAQI